MNTSTLTETIRDIVAQELDRRPIVHIHIQLPADATDPDRLADTIARVLTDFRRLPPAPDLPESPGSDTPQ